MKEKVWVNEQAEDRINFMYALSAAAAIGDKEMLEEAKRDYPEVYAEWEKGQKEIQSKK